MTKKSLSEDKSGTAQGITRKGKQQQSCDKWKEEHDQRGSCKNRTMCGHTGDEIKYNRNRSRMTSEFHVEASQGLLKWWKHLKDSLAALEASQGRFFMGESFSSRISPETNESFSKGMLDCTQDNEK